MSSPQALRRQGDTGAGSDKVLPLFPLNAHVLPGGKMKLRIFESRYLRMVREGAGRVPAFAMAMVGDREDDGSYAPLPLVTRVEVVDFEPLAGGLLGITVAGLDCALIEQLEVAPDGLRLARLSAQRVWEEALPDPHDKAVLGEAFHLLLSQYPPLAALYPEVLAGPVTDHPPRWYLLRWLEVLPLAAPLKQQLLRGRASVALAAVLPLIIDSDLMTAP